MAVNYTRRNFLGGFAKRLMGELSRGAQASLDTIGGHLDRAKPAKPVEWIRPPGALAEPVFLEICARCSNCLEACPHDSIRRLGFEFGEAEGTPAIIIEQTPCYLCEDLPCIAACTSGALQPLVDRAQARMAMAVINDDQCYAVNGQPCDYCIVRCPLGEAAIAMDERLHPHINEQGCTGCGVCAYLCPANAITLHAVKPAH